MGSSNYITNEFNIVTQHMEYMPFGEMLVEEHLNSNNEPFKFNGKELDEETGNYYYGARYYNPKWSIWLSVDPLADEFSGWSPYVYTHNNPLRYTDPTGMSADDVIIKGKEAQAAFDELQASVQGDLTLSMDDDGKVSYEQNGDGSLSRDAQQLVDAIDDHSIIANVDAQDDNFNSDRSLRVGGSFMGNTVTDEEYNGKNIVQAYQEINPDVLKKLSDANNKSGADMLHEVTEAFQGGKISQNSGISASLGGSTYKTAHGLATPQSGAINEYVVRRQANGNPGIMSPVLYLGGSPINVSGSNVHSLQWTSNNKTIQVQRF